jgi:hypothetical protein
MGSDGPVRLRWRAFMAAGHCCRAKETFERSTVIDDDFFAPDRRSPPPFSDGRVFGWSWSVRMPTWP